MLPFLLHFAILFMCVDRIGFTLNSKGLVRVVSFGFQVLCPFFVFVFDVYSRLISFGHGPHSIDRNS